MMTIKKLSKLYKVVGDLKRYKIFDYIKNNDGVETKDIIKKFKISPSILTFHIKKMKDAGIIVEEKNGKCIVYKINKTNLVAGHEFMRDAIQSAANNCNECCSGLVITNKDYAKLFALYDDERRLNIWKLITETPGITGKLIHIKTGYSEPEVSFHCKKLIESGIVNYKKFGNQTYYWLDVTLATAFHNQFCKREHVKAECDCRCQNEKK